MSGKLFQMLVVIMLLAVALAARPVNAATLGSVTEPELVTEIALTPSRELSPTPLSGCMTSGGGCPPRTIAAAFGITQ